MTGFIGVCLLLMMMILAALANAGQAAVFRNVINCVAILGMIWMLWPKSKLTLLSIENKPAWIQKPTHFFQDTAHLVGGQILFLIFSVVFMCFIEVQTRSNHRLHTLPEGYILNILKTDSLTFFFWPWVLYSVIGIGLGYFCLYKDRIPNLFNALIPPNPKQPLLFFHNYISTTVFMTLVIPFLITMAMIILLLADGLNGLGGFPSFFFNPIRSFLLALCTGILLIRINKRHLPVMVEKRNSLGRILVSYAVVAGCFLWWLSWMASFAFEGISEKMILSAQGSVKSIVLQTFSETDHHTRLSLLIWSWWLIWLPMVSSFVARYTIGRNIGLSFIAATFFPAITYFVLWTANTENLLSIWLKFCQALQWPEAQIAIALSIALLLYFTGRRIHSVADLLRGFMQDFGQMRRFPLTSWISSMLYCLIAYLTSNFLVGWLALQILATIAAWFMTTIVLAFVIMLYLENKNGKKAFFKRYLNSV